MAADCTLGRYRRRPSVIDATASRLRGAAQPRLRTGEAASDQRSAISAMAISAGFVFRRAEPTDLIYDRGDLRIRRSRRVRTIPRWRGRPVAQRPSPRLLPSPWRPCQRHCNAIRRRLATDRIRRRSRCRRDLSRPPPATLHQRGDHGLSAMKVRMVEAVADQIRAWSGEAAPLETGGLLLGCTPTVTPRITRVVLVESERVPAPATRCQLASLSMRSVRRKPRTLGSATWATGTHIQRMSDLRP